MYKWVSFAWRSRKNWETKHSKGVLDFSLVWETCLAKTGIDEGGVSLLSASSVLWTAADEMYILNKRRTHMTQRILFQQPLVHK